MQREEDKISLEEGKHRDYQSLSPVKKAKPATNEIEENPDQATETQTTKKRVPRRVLHFSDGILEEYSTDEEEQQEQKIQQLEESQRQQAAAVINTKNLSWIPWMVHYTWFAGSTFVTYCDYWGEKLAWFFGITSPKYYYEIEEFKKMQEEEEERKKKLDTEMHGWNQEVSDDPIIAVDPIKAEP